MTTKISAHALSPADNAVVSSIRVAFESEDSIFYPSCATQVAAGGEISDLALSELGFMLPDRAHRAVPVDPRERFRGTMYQAMDVVYTEIVRHPPPYAVDEHSLAPLRTLARSCGHAPMRKLLDEAETTYFPVLDDTDVSQGFRRLSATKA